MPLHQALNVENYERHQVMWKGKQRTYYSMQFEGYNIWGATAGVLMHMSRRVTCMIRVLLINALLLFLLPFALTYLWVRFIAAKKPNAQTRKYYAFAALIGAGPCCCQPADLSRHHGRRAGRHLYFTEHIKTGRLSPVGSNKTRWHSLQKTYSGWLERKPDAAFITSAE